jgi:hypothetical protein
MVLAQVSAGAVNLTAFGTKPAIDLPIMLSYII